MDYRRIGITGLVVFLMSAQSVFAYVYGDGDYGERSYGSVNESSQQSWPVPTFCTALPPVSAPNLFQIDRGTSTATLYFAPAGKPHDRYVVAYGLEASDMRFGIEFEQQYSTGVLKYTVGHLQPSQGYVFMIRGGNGCATGPWSGRLEIKANKRAGTVVKYYPSSLAKTFSLKKFIKPIVQKQPTVLKASDVSAVETNEKTETLETVTEVSDKERTKSVFKKVADVVGKFFRGVFGN